MRRHETQVRGFEIEGDGHIHVPRKEHPHVATEYLSHHPDVAEELARQLREPFKSRVVGAAAGRVPRMTHGALVRKAKQMKGERVA